jgi:putative ubiquitin-RnfH superfamily antitoxin RatB of RatAB toxin-antitoxin module
VTAPESKRCLLAVDTEEGVRLCELVLPLAASVAEAIAAARSALGDSAIDWSAPVAGLWGRRCALSDIPADGDRIEIYRALTTEPRERRRLQVQRARRRASGLRPRAR